MKNTNNRSNIKNSNKLRQEFELRLEKVTISLIMFCKNKVMSGDFRIIQGQVVRSISSIGANCFEARAASSKKDYIRFFCYSLKSANETKYWLKIIEECYCPQQFIKELQMIRKEVTEISSILAASILTMKGKRRI